MKLQLFSQDELDIVQLLAVPEGENFSLLSNAARYLESPVFSIFKYCFELSKPDYEYLELNSFNRLEIVSLRHHLLTHLTRLEAIDCAKSLESFAIRNLYGIEFINAIKNDQQEWLLSWEKIRDKLVAINKELIELVDSCIDDDKVLWIRGF